jgi:hypothetical protein
MDNLNKGGRLKRIFSKSSGEIRDENSLKTKSKSGVVGSCAKTAYPNEFKPREEATYLCGKEDQTMDHILFNCIKTREQRVVHKR